MSRGDTSAKRTRGLTREAVVAAAIALIRRDGPEALRINRLARELGIKPPSLYNHVANGDDLRRAVALEGERRLGEVFAGVTWAAGEERDALMETAGRFRAFALAERALYQVMSSTPLPPDDPDFAPVLEATLAPLLRMLAPLGLTGSEAIHRLRILRSAIHGFVLLEIGGQFGLPEDVEESFQRLRDVIGRAL